MTLLLLYQQTPSARICDNASQEYSHLKQYLAGARVFYDKVRLSALLIHHYQFLLRLHLFFNSIADMPVESPFAKLPYFHCLRADIRDICGCCPWVNQCDDTSCKLTECLGKLMAYFMIEEYYKQQHRRLDGYLGIGNGNGKRFFGLQLNNLERQKQGFVRALDALVLKAKEEGEIAAACKASLINYQHELNLALSEH